MAAPKSLSLLALAFAALVALFFAPVQANSLTSDRAHVARHAHARNAVAKRKRDLSGRCVNPPSSSLASSSPASTSASTSTSAPVATPSAAPSPPSNSQKWGLAWPNGDQWLPNFASLPNVGMIYTWSAELPDSAWNYPNLQRIVMLWGAQYVNDFQQKAVPGYATYAAFLNEPNEPSQSNTSPQDAANLWKTYMEPLKQSGYTLISAACTDDDAGLQWYQDFFAACDNGCSVDVMAFHAYTTSAQHLIDYATTLHQTYGKDVMITEFANQDFSGGPQADMDQIWDYAGQVKSFVDNTPWVAGAFPFGAMQDLQGVNTLNSLMDSQGNPTPLGYFYFG